MMKTVAIIGAGLAGVGAAWHLLEKGNIEVHLYDPTGIAQGASGVASGLLHPYTGKHALKAPRAEEGMALANDLLRVSEKALGKKVCSRTGILRPAVNEQQQSDFKLRGEWWEPEVVQKHLPHAAPIPALWIPEGITVFTTSYLQGLWLDCERKGGLFKQHRIGSLQELDRYHGVVIAAGFETHQFPECAHLPLKKTAGQIATCYMRNPIPFSMISHGHIAVTDDPHICRVGSTYEHGPVLMENAFGELKKKAALFYPPALDFELVKIHAGVRMSPKEGVEPIVKSIGENRWVFAGLGSKGMLYHALFAKELAEKF